MLLHSVCTVHEAKFSDHPSLDSKYLALANKFGFVFFIFKTKYCIGRSSNIFRALVRQRLSPTPTGLMTTVLEIID